MFSPQFGGDLFLVGPQRKLLDSTIFSPPFHFQPNTLLPHFFSYFLFFFFFFYPLLILPPTKHTLKIDHNQKTQQNNIDYLQIFYKTEVFKTVTENWATQDHQY